MNSSIEPEIIDVTGSRKRPRLFLSVVRARLLSVYSCVKGMLLVSAPAAFTLWCCAWFIEMGQQGQFLGWILLILFIPITLVFVLIAVPVNLFLLLGLIATLFGRTSVAARFSNRASGFSTKAAGFSVARRVYSRGESPDSK